MIRDEIQALVPSGSWRQVRPRDRCFVAEQPAPAPHLAHPEGCAALRIVLVTMPRVSRSCEHFPDGFDLHLLHIRPPFGAGGAVGTLPGKRPLKKAKRVDLRCHPDEIRDEMGEKQDSV